MKYVLIIAGSDSCGGAGIQADIKTITRLGAHALVAVTAVTAQNSFGIEAIHKIPAKFISKQIETVIDDVFPRSVKIGMLLTAEAVKEVASTIRKHKILNVVIDPVVRATTGKALLESDAILALKEVLFPLARVVTPNLIEASILAGKTVRDLKEMEEASRAIKDLGPDAVITGGHLRERCVDVLYDGNEVHHFSGSRIETEHDHGTGCVFSSALATFLARDYDVRESTRLAHDFTRNALIKGYPCGRGAGALRP
jgi:hydroxymethylpyrimidine/phosphomethylpyrimidine kinase